MSDIQTQIELEQLYNKNQTLPRLRSEFLVPEIIEHCKEHEIPVPFAVDLLAQMVLHKRAKVSVLVGILGPKHFVPAGRGRNAIPEVEELQACADMLLKAAEADLVDYSAVDGRFIIKIDVSRDVYEELELYQYPLPMLVMPRELRCNKDTGYHSPESRQGSVLLSGHYYEDDVCLDHLNRLNRMEYSINVNTAIMVQNQWKNLDRQKEGELLQKYEKRVRAFEKYDRNAREVLQHLLVTGNRFHLTHRYDTRGRTYVQGYHVNPQGNDWNKAVIEFANTELVRGDQNTADLRSADREIRVEATAPGYQAQDALAG